MQRLNSSIILCPIMLKKTMPFALFAAVALWAVADNAVRLTVLFRDGTSTVVDMDVDDEVTLDHEGGTLVLPQGVTYPLADIASFSLTSLKAEPKVVRWNPQTTLRLYMWNGRKALLRASEVPLPASLYRRTDSMSA